MFVCNRYRRDGSTRRGIGLLLGLSLGIAACGGPSVAPATTPKTAIRWSQTTAPQGVDVPGAEWLKIEGAGGRSTNVQVAAVLRPQGPGPFPLVVWFSDLGFLMLDFSKAAPLTANGFMVLVGCWQKTAGGATQNIDGVSYQRIPCPQNLADSDSASRALIEVGQQLPGVKKDAIGLFGMSAGSLVILRYAASSTGIGAVVVDSVVSLSGPSKVNAPVLMLGGTADFSTEEQRDYERTLRDSGNPVEAHYYLGGGHGVTYFGDFQEDAIKRTIEFFHRYLK